MEVIRVEKHPKGGHVVTIQRERIKEPPKGSYRLETEVVTEEWLKTGHLEWYKLPELDRATYGLDHERALETYYVRQKYAPKPKLYKPKPTGNPNRCMFCHTNMSGMSAQCLSCGGAMHFACANENGGKCITPGCKA